MLHSNVFKLFYSVWLNTSGTVYSPQPYSCDELIKTEVVERVANDSNFIGFKRNVDLMITLAKSDGKKIFLMSFLNAPYKRIYETRPDLKNIVGEYIEATNKNNEIMKNLCLLHNVKYIELDPDSFKSEWFIDNCHLYEPGEELKADIVFGHIQELCK
jgi:hypothetical protein